MKISKYTSLVRIYLIKEFKKFRKHLIHPKWLKIMMYPLPLKALNWFFPHSDANIVYALNKMRKMVNEGTLDYHPVKKDVGYFSFIIDKNKPFVLIAPGGGYQVVCPLIEGFPIAVRLNELGYNAFVCDYSVGKNAKYPQPMADMATFYKDICQKYGLENEEYAICGFSAGGHIAGTLGLEEIGYKKYGMKKPSFLMLCYPVITMGDKTHKGSRLMLLGKNPTKEDIDKLSIEKNVDKNYPKTYIWQCKGDTVVDYTNSLLINDALDKVGVAHKMELFDDKHHGLGLANKSPAERWLDRAINFWNEKI